MRKTFFLSLFIVLGNVIIFGATPVDGIIDSVRTRLAPDKRQTVYEVEAKNTGANTVTLTGKISDPEIYDTLMSELKTKSGVRIDDKITLLPDTLWGQIRLSVACMRTSGKYGAEMSTQALMGMPVRLLEENNGWWRIQSPDGYLGWVWRSSITQKTPEQLDQWRSSPRLVVTSHYQAKAYDDAETTSPRHIVTDLLPGNIVEGTKTDEINGRIEITLPDGRKAWADTDIFTPIEEWAAQNFNPEVILDQAYSMMGAPYLWGGTSAKATDCSGLVKVCYLANSIILRRDASQQILTGQHLEPEAWREYRAGDLLFFGEKPGGRATHVAIYDKDGWFIHCAGRVYLSSIDPESPEYANRIFLGGSRIQGMEGTDGITYVRDHPWYF